MRKQTREIIEGCFDLQTSTHKQDTKCKKPKNMWTTNYYNHAANWAVNLVQTGHQISQLTFFCLIITCQLWQVITRLFLARTNWSILRYLFWTELNEEKKNWKKKSFLNTGRKSLLNWICYCKGIFKYLSKGRNKRG